MREPIDNWWQQQLQGYTATPHPADWEAIHARLHGRRRNRLVWWILPLLLAGAIAGTLAYKSYDSAGTMETAPNATYTVNGQNGHDLESSTAIKTPWANAQKPSGKPATKENAERSPANNMQPSTGKATTSSGNPSSKRRQTTINTTKTVQPATAFMKGTASSQKTIDPTTRKTGKRQPTELTPRPSIKKAGSKEIVLAANTNNSFAEDLPAYTAPVPSAKRLSLLASTLAEKSVMIPAIKPMPSFTLTSPSSPNLATNKKIPQRSLQWWPYFNVGINAVGTNALLDLRKALVTSNDLNSGTGGSSRVVYAGNSLQAGLHAGAGMMLQKNLGKRLSLRTGLGMGYSTWQEEGNVFRDSTLPGGNLITRQPLGNFAFSYHYLSAQVPVLLSGRIGPAGPLQWGWTAGLQNNFTLSLNEKRNTNTGITTGSGNFTAQEQKDAITTKTNFWQPALQLGIYLRHEKKSAWQLEPRMTLPAAAMYKNSAGVQQVYPTTVSLQWSWRLY